MPRFAILSVAFLAVVGGYALTKGEVSEKLAVRWGAALPSAHDAPRKARQRLPGSLDDPRWDFSPKEESGKATGMSAGSALGRLAARWAEAMGWVLAPLVVLGAFSARGSAEGRAGRRLVVVFAALFCAVLVRHAMSLGYLSSRHTLSLVLVALPWAAAGSIAIARGLAMRLGWHGTPRRLLRCSALGGLIVLGVAAQNRPAHASRDGHLQAGRGLVENAGPSEAVLDTRGWAAFVSGRRSYDYWHVRQAFTDASLGYVVVGADELTANSRRGATLRAILAFAAVPVAAFPDRRGDRDAGVYIYRFRRPESWEGLRP